MPTDQPPVESIDRELIARFTALLPSQEEVAADLLRRYREPHRRYHTVDHLAAVLDWIDRLATGEDLLLVRLAAWFHDAVYAIPPGQVSNEEASARLAFRVLGRVGLEQEDLNQVARLVRLTATHRPGPRDPEGELLCDADLAVLAAGAEEYEHYVAAIRAEYAGVPEQAFLAGRLAVLTELLETDLFRTAKGRALAPAARANLERECRDLARLLGLETDGAQMEGSNS